MKNIFLVFLCGSLNLTTLFCTEKVIAQSFRKGDLLVSPSAGLAFSNNSTTINDNKLNGLRIPIIIEYGLTNRLSVGILGGCDIYNINTGYYRNLRTFLGIFL